MWRCWRNKCPGLRGLIGRIFPLDPWNVEYRDSFVITYAWWLHDRLFHGHHRIWTDANLFAKCTYGNEHFCVRCAVYFEVNYVTELSVNNHTFIFFLQYKPAFVQKIIHRSIIFSNKNSRNYEKGTTMWWSRGNVSFNMILLLQFLANRKANWNKYLSLPSLVIGRGFRPRLCTIWTRRTNKFPSNTF